MEKYGKKALLLASSACVVSVAVLAALSIRFSAGHTSAQLFVFLLYGVGFLCAVAFSLVYYRQDSSEGRFWWKRWPYRVAAKVSTAVLLGVLLEALTVFGSPLGHVLAFYDWDVKRLVFFCAVCYLLLFFLDVAKKNRNVPFRRRVTNLSWLAKVGACLVLPVGLFAIASCLHSAFFSVAASLVSLLVLFFFAWRLRFYADIEWLFLGIATIFGSFLVFLVPVTSGVSWDDQIHYSNALDTSYVLTSQHTMTDNRFIDEAPLRALGEDVVSLSDWSDESHLDHVRELNASYGLDVAEGNATSVDTWQPLFSLSSLGYVPSSVGLWIARLFHFSFTNMILLGRFFNMMAYVLAFFLAIKVTPRKKLLFAVVGLIPTSLFLSASYSYDAWLIATTALGLALFLRATWNDEVCFDAGYFSAALLLIFVGLAVKAVYFPILGLLFLIPGNLFSARKSKRLYQSSIVAVAFVLLASFAIPFLLSSQTNTGDARGGSDVNSAEQLRFILSDPLRFASILTNYLLGDFLNPSHANFYLTNYAYLGKLCKCFDSEVLRALANYIPLLLVVCVALSSGDGFTSQMAGISRSLWALFLFLITVALVATALYISFTPVGLGTVNGCQYRYLLPWLLPGMFFVLNNPWRQVKSGRLYNCVMLVFSSIVLLSCTSLVCFAPLFGFSAMS